MRSFWLVFVTTTSTDSRTMTFSQVKFTPSPGTLPAHLGKFLRPDSLWNELISRSRKWWHMNIHRLFIALIVSVSLAACATAPRTDPVVLPSGNWIADPAHTSVTFRIAHGGGLSRYTARFDTVTASLSFDPENPGDAALTATIVAESISTGLPAFDKKLANEIFKAEMHPQLVFASDEIVVSGTNTGTARGVLTMAGEARPATLNITFNGGAFDPLRGKQVIGFSATTTLNRTEWGLDTWVNFGVGETVDVAIEIEFMKED
jgi:polyisoprenoid-binding protein YceI